jgi:Nif-specific regulatory protein
MPLVVQNIATHPLFDPADVATLSSDDATVSFIGVPIRADGKVVGALTIDRIWDGQSMFRFDSDVRFLAMVANLVGQTIKLHRVVARDRERLMAESHRLQKELSEYKPAVESARAGGILGDSTAISSLVEKIAIVAKSHAPVHLRGESGTRKELFARVNHDLSPCAKGPFIKINCAALPESVLESELFGHEKGAFTGAINARKGRFELADKGTLFPTRLARFRRPSRPSCCACSRRASSNGSAAPGPSRSMSGLSRRPTGTSKTPSPGTSSAPTSTIASVWYR